MDLEEIEAEIQRLEQSKTTYDNCTKLAVLYSIRDHRGQIKKIAEYNAQGSEFLQAAAGAPIEGLLDIIDEHLDAIEILHPREYSAIIRRIKEL